MTWSKVEYARNYNTKNAPRTDSYYVPSYALSGPKEPDTADLSTLYRGLSEVTRDLTETARYFRVRQPQTSMGSAIALARSYRRLSLDNASKYLGCTPRALHLLEQRQRICLDELRRIAAVLRCEFRVEVTPMDVVISIVPDEE